MRFWCCDFAEWVWKVSGTEGEQKSSSPNSIWGEWEWDYFVFSRKWMFEICGPNMGQSEHPVDNLFIYFNIYI